MISKEQIEKLAKYYQIDQFTIIREYLQLLFLSYLYQQKEGKDIYFKGGTAIRLLFGSPRFSEDLDFSTTLDKKMIKKIVYKTEKLLNQEIETIKIYQLYSGKETERYRIKYQGREIKYPLVIRLDFHRVKKIEKKEVSPLMTKFPIVFFPIICHLPKEIILKEKLQALSTRAKGRDFFDVWFLMKKGVKVEGDFNKKVILQKIQSLSEKKLKRELDKFLPLPQRQVVDLLKKELQEQIF